MDSFKYRVRQNKGILLLTGLLILLFGNSLLAFGESEQEEGMVGYSVAATIPENQIHEENTFFDLKMEPKQTQQIKATVFNSTDKDIVVETAIHTAYTSAIGQIEYGKDINKFDASLKYRLKDLLKLDGEKRITVPARGKKEISATLTMPKEYFQGVLLGSWYFSRVDNLPKETDEKKGMTITSQYSYAIGIKLTEDHEVVPDLKLLDVQAGMLNYHKGVFAKIQNHKAVIVPNLSIEGVITKEDEEGIVKQAKLENLQMAPNSNFDFPILYDKQKLEPGDYHLKIKAKSESYSWVLDQDFSISAKKAKKYNIESLDDTSGKKMINIALIFGIAGIILTILIVLLIVLIYKRIKRRR